MKIHMASYPRHAYFETMSLAPTKCSVWVKKEYLTGDKDKVTCKTCLKIMERMNARR